MTPAPFSADLYLRVRVILGIKAERWRVLVEEDAEVLDQWVRSDFARQVGWRLGG